MKLIKTKLFTGFFTGTGKERKFIDIDTEINHFLNQNEVELIDIKFAVSTDSDGTAWNSALMIYKVRL